MQDPHRARARSLAIQRPEIEEHFGSGKLPSGARGKRFSLVTEKCFREREPTPTEKWPTPDPLLRRSTRGRGKTPTYSSCLAGGCKERHRFAFSTAPRPQTAPASAYLGTPTGRRVAPGRALSGIVPGRLCLRPRRGSRRASQRGVGGSRCHRSATGRIDELSRKFAAEGSAGRRELSKREREALGYLEEIR